MVLSELDRLNTIFKALDNGLLADEIDILLSRQEKVPKGQEKRLYTSQKDFPLNTDASRRVARIVAAIPGVRRVRDYPGPYQTSGGYYEARVDFPGALRWKLRIDIRNSSAISQLKRRTAASRGLQKEEIRGWFAQQGVVLLSTQANRETIITSFQEQMRDIHLANMLLGRVVG